MDSACDLRFHLYNNHTLLHGTSEYTLISAANMKLSMVEGTEKSSAKAAMQGKKASNWEP